MRDPPRGTRQIPGASLSLDSRLHRGGYKRETLFPALGIAVSVVQSRDAIIIIEGQRERCLKRDPLARRTETIIWRWGLTVEECPEGCFDETSPSRLPYNPNSPCSRRFQAFATFASRRKAPCQDRRSNDEKFNDARLGREFVAGVLLCA